MNAVDAEILPNGDDAVREQRLCAAIRRYWGERGFYGVATAVEAVMPIDLPAKTVQARLYVIRSNLIGAMPPEMGGRWSTREKQHGTH